MLIKLTYLYLLFVLARNVPINLELLHPPSPSLPPAYRGHLTPGPLSPGVGNLTQYTIYNIQYTIWFISHSTRGHQVAEGGEFDRTRYCVRDRMADQKWAVEIQGRFCKYEVPLSNLNMKKAN